MSDLPVVLLVIFVLLAMVTLVGHGIWVLLANFFGRGRKVSSQACPLCGKSSPAGHERCDGCGRDLTSPIVRELRDLEAVRRQLMRFRRNGTLQPAVIDRMLCRLEDYRQRLIHPQAQPVARTADVAPAKSAEPVAATAIATAANVVPPAAVPPAKPRLAPAAPVATPPLPPHEIPPVPEPVILLAESETAQRPAAAIPVPVPSPALSPIVKAHPPVATPPVAMPRPQAPSLSWTEMLASFMEQRNIRWGELIGGLLFVCSSVALVVSLWDTIGRIPYSKFFIFVSISSSVFGVGLYAHHRWKLESTSRALLMIATLLVPLNFVAIAILPSATVLSKAHWTLLTLASELVSLVIFGYLVDRAARVLVPDGRWATLAAVLGDSVAVLLIARLIHGDSPAWLMLAAGALPVALFAGAIGVYLFSRIERAKSRPLRLTDSQIACLFTLLGITAFSTAVALGLLVTRAIAPLDPAQGIRGENVAIVLQRLSVLFAMTAIAPLAVALTVIRGSRRKKDLAAYHLASTNVALVAMLVMLAALAMAWPSPGWLLAVCVMNSVTLALAAFRWHLPVLHSGAIACAAFAYLIVFYSAIGRLALSGAEPSGAGLFRLLTDAQSGTALGGLFLTLAAVSELLARTGYRRHGVYYLGGSSVVAIVGMLLVTIHGFLAGGHDALRAAILYGIYGCGSLGLTARWRRLGLSYLGLGLVTSAAFWALWSQPATQHVGPLWGAVLAIESLVMVVAAAVLQRRAPGTWYDPWRWIATEVGLWPAPRSKSLSLVEMYRIPLIQIGELAAWLAAAMAIVTAARDWDLIIKSSTPAPVIACVAIATLFFLLAWLYRSAPRTWIASLVVLAGAIHTLNFNYFPCTDYLGPGWTIALLGHATLVLVAALCLDRLRSAGDFVRQAIADPLAGSALLSSIVVVPALIFGRSPHALWLACCFPWLAAVWFGLAWRNRSAALFAAHQMALSFATIAATTVWLKHVGWVDVSVVKLPPAPNLLERIACYSHVLLKPLVLQSYGVTLGLLSLIWIGLRIFDLRRGLAPDRLLQSRWSVDWYIRHGIVWIQWLIAALCVLGEVPHELLGGTVAAVIPTAVPDAFGPTAWVLLAGVTAMLAATLWERWGTAELFAALLAAATLPCLIAGRFAMDLAVASASRWTLAIAFAACSVAVWSRRRLAGACLRLHAGPFAPGAQSPLIAAPRLARGVLLATLVVPVLAITVLAAMLQIGGTAAAGPVASTFFETLGPQCSYLVPLVLVIGALVGFALRERSSVYAFAAGAVLEMAVVLGYALHITLAKQQFDITFRVTLIQLFAVTAAAWAIVWLVARKRLDVWRESPASGVSSDPMSGGLMRVQIGMSIAANALVLGIALLVLAVFYPGPQTWSVATGGPLGWISLLLPLAAIALRGRIRPQAVGLSGMAVLGLLACTIRGLSPVWHLEVDAAWGYRALMLGWAVYSLLIVAATWWIASLRTAPDAAGPPQGLIRMAAVWVRVAGLLAVLLGLKAAFSDQHQGEQLWAAAAIAIASGAGATMAVWRRREGWAFSAALGVNLAASLVAWHFELLRETTFDDFWLRLLQANVIASAGVAMAWLAARKRLYELHEDRGRMAPTLGECPLLAIQVLLPVVGNFFLAVMPVAWLIHTPSRLPPWMNDVAAPQGWTGLLLTAAVAAWYLRQTSLASMLNVLGGLALAAGALGACGMPLLMHNLPAESWVAYHSLTTAWAAAGLIFLAVAIGAGKWLGPRRLVHPWLVAIGTLTVCMATLHAFSDPARPWWAAAAILAVSLTAGLAAVTLRKPGQVYASGLLINLAGTIVWWAHSPSGPRWPGWNMADLAGLVQANVLCLAIGSVVWSVARVLARGKATLEIDGQPPFAHVAAQLAAVALGLVTAVGVLTTVFELNRIPVGQLDWIALAGVAAATTVCLGQRTRFALPTLYCLGLSAVGLGLLARQLSPRGFCWSAADELAAFSLAVAAIAWILPHGLRRIVRGDYPWFSHLQAAVVCTAAGLAVWVTIDCGFDGCGYPFLRGFLGGRTAAVPGLLALLLTAIVMASTTADVWRARWQGATFTLGVLCLAGVGWAVLAADGPAPWLHRSVILMVAAAAVGLISGFGLKGILYAGSDWIQRGRQAVPALAALAIGMLAAVLVQEALLFRLPNGAPMFPIAIGVVILALLSLIAGCIALAVLPAADPLRLGERGRQAYVYAAEVLAAAIGLHVWLTMHWLFKGYLIDYWMLVVMAVAFTGAGLSEWFHRRGVPVLSRPLSNTALLLPLLPAAGFWLAPMFEPNGPWHLVGRAPAVWFLMAMFYGILAGTRRSWKCAALAVLAANLGLWVGLNLSGFAFLRNPQLFIMPVALAGLVAEYLNHDRLSEAQSAAFRYLALSAIYVSSTADMFIAGLGNSWSLPLVLMLLSVVGMLAGISLRVRSFLFLGLTFLMLDILSMIWHAAHDLHYTWLWYVCGIALGAAILAMFAVFEKRRNDVLAAVEQLKDWAK
jgi:hypothetical protein